MAFPAEKSVAITSANVCKLGWAICGTQTGLWCTHFPLHGTFDHAQVECQEYPHSTFRGYGLEIRDKTIARFAMSPRANGRSDLGRWSCTFGTKVRGRFRRPRNNCGAKSKIVPPSHPARPVFTRSAHCPESDFFEAHIIHCRKKISIHTMTKGANDPSIGVKDVSFVI